MKILLAEDDFLGRKMIVDLLEPHGQVDIAVNGVEAIEAVQNALSANEPYELICLDIMMPKMDGQETLKKIRRIEEQACLHKEQGAKIFMMTALSDRDNVIEAARAECNAYLIKPVLKDKLEAELLNHGLMLPKHEPAPDSSS